MNKRTRSLIKGVSVVIVGLAVLSHMDILNLAFIRAYEFWWVVIGFGLMLIVSK